MTQQKQSNDVSLPQDLVEQEKSEQEYHGAAKLDQIATAERAAQLLHSDVHPDGVCPV